MSTAILTAILDGLGALVVGFLFIYIGSFLAQRGKSRNLDDRLQRFSSPTAEIDMGALGDPSRVNGFNNLLQQLRSRLLSHNSGKSDAPVGDRETHVAEVLARADLKLKPAEWYLIRCGAFIFAVLVGVVVYREVVFILICAVIGFFAPGFVLLFRQRKRLAKFNSQLGDTLVLLSNALKAGYSFPQAMATIAQNSDAPIAEEFARANREIQLGISSNDALLHMVTRIQSEDLDLVVTAVGIQREVGGNLAEILDSIAFTIRERIRIKGEIKSLTAQARASSYIITALPMFLLLIMQGINPNYIGPLLNFAGPGPYILMVCILGIALAFYIMQKIANIEI